MQTIDFPITFLAQKHLKAKVSSVSQSFEIIYVLSGAVQISRGFARALYYEQGDLTMIRSGVDYVLVPKQACIILHIGITHLWRTGQEKRHQWGTQTKGQGR